jgi:CitMHS family citrate-Mg2+:H+ or citrate-Ca2+:H+ symporter
MSASIEIIFAVMVVSYIIAKSLKVSTELSMFFAAIAGGLVGGVGIPARHIAEGAFTYLDIILIFFTATFFMNLLKESGGVVYVVRGIIQKFSRKKSILFVLITLLLLLPMLTAAGVNMPYVGFFLPLLIPCVVLSLLTIFILGWRGKPVDLEKALKELPEAPPKMNWIKVILPFLVFFILMLAGRIWPHSLPVIGLPLMFVVAAVVSYFLSPVRLNIFDIARNTVHQLLPLIGTLLSFSGASRVRSRTHVGGCSCPGCAASPSF